MYAPCEHAIDEGGYDVRTHAMYPLPNVIWYLVWSWCGRVITLAEDLCHFGSVNCIFFFQPNVPRRFHVDQVWVLGEEVLHYCKS